MMHATADCMAAWACPTFRQIYLHPALVACFEVSPKQQTLMRAVRRFLDDRKLAERLLRA